ncbi:hypothetical protein AB0M34_33180 [Nocardia sp. NPDC050193]
MRKRYVAYHDDFSPEAARREPTIGLHRSDQAVPHARRYRPLSQFLAADIYKMIKSSYAPFCVNSMGERLC